MGGGDVLIGGIVGGIIAGVIGAIFGKTAMIITAFILYLIFFATTGFIGSLIGAAIMGIFMAIVGFFTNSVAQVKIVSSGINFIGEYWIYFTIFFIVLFVILYIIGDSMERRFKQFIDDGDKFVLERNYEEAVSQYQYAVKVFVENDKRNADVWLKLGDTFEIMGKRGEATNAYNRALSLRPSWSEAIERKNRIIASHE